MIDDIVTTLREKYQAALQPVASVWDTFYRSSWNKELTLENTLGEERAAGIKSKGLATQGKVDNYSNTLYSFVVGSAVDIVKTGLGPAEWMASRVFNFLVGIATTKHYGIYKDFMYRMTKTTTQSSWLRQKAVDLVVFNTTQVPLYGILAAASMYFTGRQVDLHRVAEGMEGAAWLSIIIGPTMNWTMDKGREFFGLPTSAEKAEWTMKMDTGI